MTLHSSKARLRLSILINIVAPYRLPIYKYLAERFETLVVEGRSEDNRNWASELELGDLKVKRSWGFQLKRHRKTAVPGVRDTHYLQFDLSAITDLPRHHPDIIITNEMGVRTAIALVYGSMMRLPVWVWSGSTLLTERNIGPIKTAVRKLMVRSNPYWISYGEAASEYLLSLDVPSRRVLQIQNCVDESIYAPSPQVRERGEELLSGLPHPICLCVGQLIARKGLTLLLESAARLQNTGISFSLAFAGGGQERTVLEELVQKLGLKNVRFLGALPSKDVRSLYQASHFLVFPTLEEVWGLVVNEALLSGLPVACSQYAGCAREVLPAEAHFNPLDSASLDLALTRGIEGTLPAPQLSRLFQWEQVAGLIAESIRKNTPTRVPTPSVSQAYS